MHLKILQLNFTEIIPFDNQWLAFVLLFSVIGLIVSKHNSSTINNTFYYFFNLRSLLKNTREELKDSVWISILLLTIAFLQISTTFYCFTNQEQIIEYDFSTFCVFFIIILAWYTFNLLIKRSIAYITNTLQIDYEANRYNNYFFIALGLLLLPANIGFLYLPKTILNIESYLILEIYIAIITIGLFLNKVIQSVFQCFEIKFSWFYIFLYICTLEILPLSIVFQLLTNKGFI